MLAEYRPEIVLMALAIVVVVLTIVLAQRTLLWLVRMQITKLRKKRQNVVTPERDAVERAIAADPQENAPDESFGFGARNGQALANAARDKHDRFCPIASDPGHLPRAARPVIFPDPAFGDYDR